MSDKTIILSMTKHDLESRIKRGDFGNTDFVSLKFPHDDVSGHLYYTRYKDELIGWYEEDTQTLELFKNYKK